jgi:hypothetical protein
MLNIASVPILIIVLRNNVLDVIPVKLWINRCGKCLFLLDDHKNSVKGIWSIVLFIPAMLMLLVTRDVGAIVTYTGGFCGVFILIFFPVTLVYYARKMDQANP